MTSSSTNATLLLIDELPLRRAAIECFLAGWSHDHGMNIISVSGYDNRYLSAHGGECKMVVVSTGISVCHSRARAALVELERECRNRPMVVIADTHSVREIVEAFSFGVQGFLPTSLEATVARNALSFVLTGGTYVPPCVLRKLTDVERAITDQTGDGSGVGGSEEGTARTGERTDAGGVASASDEGGGAGSDMAAPAPCLDILTGRQARVLMCLREGRSNKEIARELDMSEATVKVHVRQVMKKLGVRNRTQAAPVASVASAGTVRESAVVAGGVQAAVASDDPDEDLDDLAKTKGMPEGLSRGRSEVFVH